METVSRIVFGIVGLIVLVLLLWLSLYLFVALVLVGGGVFAFFYLRNLLTQKGILNPTPGMPLEGTGDTVGPVIEGDFKEIPEGNDSIR